MRVEYESISAHRGFLAKGDTDGFARWDALQGLLVSEVKGLMKGRPLSSSVSDVFGTILEEAIAAKEPDEMFLLATMLTPPSEAYLFEQVSPVDVDAIVDALDTVSSHLGKGLSGSWKRLYDETVSKGEFQPTPKEMARRSLHSIALRYLAKSTDDGVALESLLDQHLKRADNLTDRRAAFDLICSSDVVSKGFREKAIEAFFERFKEEALVINGWFAAQAASRLTGIDGMKTLASHKAFDSKNPNKIRSLYGAFASRNYKHFHALDGSGYNYMAQRIIELDGQNPQVASRLCVELTRFRRYQPKRQELMKGALKQIADKKPLSNDVFEIVTKSLEG